MGGEQNELVEYMNLNFSKDTDLIQCWLARQVLCVPASLAASERLFSTAGRLLEKRQTTSSPATVNSLLFL